MLCISPTHIDTFISPGTSLTAKYLSFKQPQILRVVSLRHHRRRRRRRRRRWACCIATSSLYHIVYTLTLHINVKNIYRYLVFSRRHEINVRVSASLHTRRGDVCIPNITFLVIYSRETFSQFSSHDSWSSLD